MLVQLSASMFFFILSIATHFLFSRNLCANRNCGKHSQAAQFPLLNYCIRKSLSKVQVLNASLNVQEVIQHWSDCLLHYQTRVLHK